LIGVTDGGLGMDASSDASDADFTSCTTPEGYQICATQGVLPICPTNTACEQCTCDDFGGIPGCLGLCAPTVHTLLDAGLLTNRSCEKWCDEAICFSAIPTGGPENSAYQCVPSSIGVLLGKYEQDAASGYRNVVRYGDMSAWTGDPIPNIACPAVTGYALCGGACGACGDTGDICAGRSPLHPFGVCVPSQPPVGQDNSLGDAGKNGPTTCASDAGEGAVAFIVDAPSQHLANQYGRCMPLATCQAIAGSFPGGATCTPVP
jgi:hypothetical protein